MTVRSRLRFPILSVAAAAEAIGRRRSRLVDAVLSGGLPPVAVPGGRGYFVTATDLAIWLETPDAHRS